MSHNLILSALPLCLYVEQLCNNMLCAFLPVWYSALCMRLVILWWLILALCLGTITLQWTGYITKRHTFPAVCHSMIYGMTERMVCRFRMSDSANLDLLYYYFFTSLASSISTSWAVAYDEPFGFMTTRHTVASFSSVNSYVTRVHPVVIDAWFP